MKLTDKYPLLVLLGFFPPVYLFGLIRFRGRPWVTATKRGGWQSGLFDDLQGFWWPIKLYQRKQYEQGRFRR